MPPKAFLSVYMYGFLLRMIWEGIRVYNARKKRQMDILSGLSANGAVMFMRVVSHPELHDWLMTGYTMLCSRATSARTRVSPTVS